MNKVKTTGDKLSISLPDFTNKDAVEIYLSALERIKDRYGVKKLLRASKAYINSLKQPEIHMEVIKGTLLVVNGNATDWQKYKYEETKVRRAAYNFYGKLSDRDLRIHATFLVNGELSSFDIASMTRDELYKVMVDLMVEKKMEEKYGTVEETKSKRTGDIVAKEGK